MEDQDDETKGNPTNFVVHRREPSITSKRSYSSSTYGPYEQDIEDGSHLELDVISLGGHQGQDRPFAPHPSLVRPRTADAARSIGNNGTPIVVIEESS